MIKKKFHPSKIAVSIFILFWVIFGIFFGIKEAGKVADNFQGIKKAGELRVSMEEDPFNFYKDENGYHGFQYELVKTFADKQGLKLKIELDNNLSKRIKSLINDDCDLLVGPLPVTIELRKILEFTNVVFESRFVLIQRKSTSIRPNEIVRNPIDFGGMEIYTTDNVAVIARLHNLSTEISDTIKIHRLRIAGNERLISLVASGLIDYAACDLYVARSYQSNYPSIDCETPIGFNHFESWAVKPGKTVLLDSLNVFINNFKKSPAFEALKVKYKVQ